MFALRLLVLMLIWDSVSGEICRDSVCTYTFKLMWSQTMATQPSHNGQFYRVGLEGDQLKVASYSNYFRDMSPLMGSSLEAARVITADGHVRNAVTVNAGFPGPNVEVLEGAQVVVEVDNQLDVAVTLHWHGMHQAATPWMDGVGHLTQCPILPGQKFTYRFQASPAGTHWYHGHTQNVRLDGLFGLFVVYPKEPEVPNHLMSVQDWNQDGDSRAVFVTSRGTPEMTRHMAHMHMMGHEHLGTLINGRGRSNDIHLPLAEFPVTSGQRYRFRVANAAAENTYRISVDGHALTVVASDGYELAPISCDAAYVHPGESLDFEIEADQEVSRYWIRALGSMLHGMDMDDMGMGDMDMDEMMAHMNNSEGMMGHVDDGGGMGIKGMGMNETTKMKRHTAGEHMLNIEMPDMHDWTGGGMGGSDPDTSMHGNHTHEIQEGWAILSYSGSSQIGDPTSEEKKCTKHKPCQVFNCPSKTHFESDTIKCIGFDSDNVKSRPDMVDDVRDFYGVGEDAEVEEHMLNFAFSISRFPGSSINNRHFVHPTAPLFQNNQDDGHIVKCDETQCDRGCQCTNILKVPTNKVIQLVFTNLLSTGAMMSSHHPIHLHGHGFAVLAVGSPPAAGKNNPDLVCDDDLCGRVHWKNKPALRFTDPPIKDTIMVPAGGYVVVRFVSNSPGYWFLHCHQQQHLIDGMGLILQEGDPSEMAPLPPRFPTCPRAYDMGEATYTVYQSSLEQGATSNQTTLAVSSVEAVALSLTESQAVGAAIGFFLLGAAVTGTLLLLLMRHQRRAASHMTLGGGDTWAKYGSDNVAFRM